MKLEQEFKYKTEEFFHFRNKVNTLIDNINELQYDGYIKDTIILKKLIDRYNRYLSKISDANLNKIKMQEYTLSLMQSKYNEIKNSKVR